MASLGISEIKRHFQREQHLLLDHKNPARVFTVDVRGRDARVLYRRKREKEKSVFIDYEVPEIGSENPFTYDVADGEPFTFTTENSRVVIQLQLLMTFEKSSGKTWGLEDYWTQASVLTGNSAAVVTLVGAPNESVSVIILILWVVTRFFTLWMTCEMSGGFAIS